MTTDRRTSASRVAPTAIALAQSRSLLARVELDAERVSHAIAQSQVELETSLALLRGTGCRGADQADGSPG
jgi:hypothetical protein